MEPQPMLPDNRCCYILTLRKGSAIIGIMDTVVNIICFAFYTNSWIESKGETTNLDVGYFVLFAMQLICNACLIFGAIKKSPAFTLPWLTMNVGLIAIFLVLITLLLFFGSIQTPLTTDQFTSFLSTLGLLGAVLLFCWLIVFQFRKNLILEKRILSTYIPSAPSPEDDMPQNYRRPPSPPPSYEEVSKASMLSYSDKTHDRTKGNSSCQKLSKIEEEKRVNHDELPPEYATAVAMTPAVNAQLLSSNISQPL